MSQALTISRTNDEDTCADDGNGNCFVAHTTTTSNTSFLMLPSLVREKIYTFLSQKQHLILRFVCLKLLEEVDNFADFSVVMKSPSRGREEGGEEQEDENTCSEANDNDSNNCANLCEKAKKACVTSNVSILIPIPFPYLKLLTIDNDQQDLPWNLTTKILEQQHESHQNGDDDSQTLAPIRKCLNGFQGKGAVQSVHLGAVSFQTFLHLSRYKTIKSATLTQNTFVRPIPTLHWTFLKTLRVKFVCTSNIEQFMLDNFDSLCVQMFPNLENLSIAMCNTVYPNIQSAYSIRILRFVTKHWQSLRSLEVSMEAECCISHHYVGQHMCPGLSGLDLADMKKVQLTAFTLNATELSCPRCSIWQEFIRQQSALQTIEISISCAMRLRSDFFCPTNPGATRNLQSVVITMWGMDGYFPFDFRHLEEAPCLRNLELVRHTQARSQLSRPELLNVSSIPPGVVSLTLNGFLISSLDVPILLKRTSHLRNLILIDCGFGLDIGVLLEHVSLLAQHPCYATAIIDFNTPVISTEEAISVLSEEMDSHQLIFQYLFEIPASKNLRFWFVHPDRVGNLEQTGYSKDVLLSCDVLSEYSQNFYFDDEYDVEGGGERIMHHHPGQLGNGNEDAASNDSTINNNSNNNNNNSNPPLLLASSSSVSPTNSLGESLANTTSNNINNSSLYFHHEISAAEEYHHQEPIPTAS